MRCWRLTSTLMVLLVSLAACQRHGESQDAPSDDTTSTAVPEAPKPPTPQPADEEAPEPEAAEATPDCADDRLAWRLDLDAGQWVAMCYPGPIRRDTALWGSDGRRVANLAPARCLADDDPTTLTVATPDQVEAHETEVAAFHFGHGAGLGWLGDIIVATGGERCVAGKARHEVHAFRTDGQLATWYPHRVGGAYISVWPVLFAPEEPDREPRLLAARDMSTRGGSLDVRRAPGIDLANLGGDGRCYQVYPDVAPEPRDEVAAHCNYDPDLGGASEDHRNHYHGHHVHGSAFSGPYRYDYQTAANLGTPLTWAYDPHADEILYLGALIPTLKKWPIGDIDTALRWQVRADAWRVPRRDNARWTPTPPVVGDGVTLLFDTAKRRYLLIDPFGEASYTLDPDDAEAWHAIEHAALPATPTSLRTDRRLDLAAVDLQDAWGDPVEDPPVMRFTRWRWPYFAYFDEALGAPVVIPYDRGESLCLPLQGLDGLYGCPASHP